MEDRFPSHSEFYRDFHLVEEEFIKLALNEIGFNFKKISKPGTIVLKDGTTTEYDYTFEKGNWDIIIHFDDYYKNENVVLLIEYKSSIKEWGKQVDAYMRQLNKRINAINLMGDDFPSYNGIPKGEKKVIITSFDDRFETYKNAFKRIGVHIIVLPKDLLDNIKNEK